jgi:hypothetical protein
MLFAQRSQIVEKETGCSLLYELVIKKYYNRALCLCTLNSP